METEKIGSFVRSKKFSRATVVVGVVAGALILFHAGVQFGYSKAQFIAQNGDVHYLPFGRTMMHDAHMPGFLFDDPASSHGVSGKIISITPTSIVVADNDATEKVVNLEPETVIRELRNTITSDELKIDDVVVVIGEPTESAEIEARLIRVLPQTMMGSTQIKSGIQTNTISTQ